ncbi:MAPK kinase substrate protein [Glycine soja]
MAGLQRSAVSFRRQGSSGFVWDDRFLSEELNKVKEDQNNNNDGGPEIKELHQVQTTPPPERTRSNGGARGYRTGKVSPAIEPPSPRLSACGFCAAFGKAGDNKPQRTTPAKHRPREERMRKSHFQQPSSEEQREGNPSSDGAKKKTEAKVTDQSQTKKAININNEDINASADAFIKNFRQQLLIQRLQSIENYEQMLARGH